MKDVKLSSPVVHPGGADDRRALFPVLVQKAGDHHVVEDLNTQPATFFVQRRFDLGAPDTDTVPGVVIVSEEQFAGLISEIRALELVAGIPDLYPHLLQFQQAFVTFAAGDVLSDAATPAVEVFNLGESESSGDTLLAGLVQAACQ